MQTNRTRLDAVPPADARSVDFRRWSHRSYRQLRTTWYRHDDTVPLPKYRIHSTCWPFCSVIWQGGVCALRDWQDYRNEPSQYRTPNHGKDLTTWGYHSHSSRSSTPHRDDIKHLYIPWPLTKLLVNVELRPCTPPLITTILTFLPDELTGRRTRDTKY